MQQIKITFPDGSVKEFQKGITAQEIVKGIGPRLEKDALAAKADDKLVDLTTPLTKDCTLKILTYKDKEGKEVFRHSASHIMADAVKRIFPNVKLTIGPAVEDGFYYDFDTDKPFSAEDLKKIEDEMQKIIGSNAEFKRIEISSQEAKKKFKELGEDYKLELIQDLGDEQITCYEHGKFVDLCRGPHVPHTGKIKAIKLTKIAGAYWRGKAENKQLQRIYGIAFPDKKEMDEYLKILEEAEKRDHRKLGKEMDLIMIHEYAPGMPFFLPKGMTMLIELLKFVREYSYGEGYKEVKTPQVFNAELWKTSGHWGHYKENMFIIHHAEDKVDMALKAMNCPGHMLVFKRDARSYKDLPLRIAETTTLYRNEVSGTLTGLTRVRALSQDDTHIFCRNEQILSEINLLLEKIKTIYQIFGLQIDEINLSTRPKEFMGDLETWNKAEANLKEALEKAGMEYRINEGDGAFYGPKIDFKVKDALKRQWQLATIQLDFQMPQKFGLYYIDEDNSRKTPVVIHRAILGTMERFLGILIEHYAGRFPLWLSPVQAKILSVADRFNPYAEKVAAELKANGFKIELDLRTESIPKKVREAQLEKIPIIITVGEKEESAGTVAPRTLDGKVKFGVKLSDLIAQMKKVVDEKRIVFEL